MKLKKGWKVLFWIVGIVIALLIIVSIAVRLIFTKEKLIAMVQPQVEKALSRKVSIEDISPSIFSGLGVDIKGLEISNLPGYEQKDLFKIKNFSVRVKLWPLLKKRIEVRKIILDQPEIFIEKNKEGVLSIADLMKPSGASFPLILFENVQIKNGSFTYDDLSNGSKIFLGGIDEKGKLTADQKYENGRSEGKFSIQKIDLKLPGFKSKIPELSLALQHKISFSLPGDSLNIEQVKIDLAKVSLEIKGVVRALKTTPQADLVLNSKDISIQDLLSSIPADKNLPLTQLKSSGIMRVTASLKGELKGKTIPNFKGLISLKDVKVGFTKVPQPFVLPSGQIDFDNQGLSVVTQDAKLGNTPLELKAVIDNYADPNLTAELKTKFELAIVKEVQKLPEGTNLSGSVDIDAKAFGKLKKPEQLDLSGNLNLRNVEIASPNLTVPVKNLNSDMSLSKGILNIDNLSLNLGKSSISLNGKVQNVIQSLIPGKGIPQKPFLSFKLNSPLMDLDEIMPVKPQTKPQEKQQVKTAPPFPDIDASGQVEVKKLIFRQVELQNLVATLEVKNRVVKVQNVAANVYNGLVGGNATYDMTNVNDPKFDIKFSASKIEANNFLSRIALFKDHLFGNLNMTADFSGNGLNVEQITKSLIASGNGTITDGRLVNWDLLNQVSSYLKMNESKEEKIRTLTNSFKVNNGRVFFEDFQALTTSGDWKATGSVGLDGSLDYTVNLVLSPELSSRINLGDLTKFFQDENGRTVLDFKIEGNAKSPKFSISTARAEKKFQQQLQQQKDKATEDLKKKAGDLLKGLFKK
ncbi:MAG TPA: AsmA family protein [Terriglobales bacterium]|nr:AsmA family protein [Terriglobales bacterium]